VLPLDLVERVEQAVGAVGRDRELLPVRLLLPWAVTVNSCQYGSSPWVSGV